MQATSQNRQLKQKTHKDAEIRISSIMESISTTKKKKKKKQLPILKKRGKITYIIVIVAVVRSRGGTEASRLENSPAFGSPPPDSPRTRESLRRRQRTTRRFTSTGSHPTEQRPVVTP